MNAALQAQIGKPNPHQPHRDELATVIRAAVERYQRAAQRGPQHVSSHLLVVLAGLEWRAGRA